MQILNENAIDLVKKLERVADEPTELLAILKSSTFNIMSESILGMKVNDEKYGSKIAMYTKSLETIFETTIYRYSRPWLYWDSMMIFSFQGRQYLKLCNEINSFTKEIILKMKKTLSAREILADGEDIYKENRKSFAQVLIEQHLKDPTFTVKDIQDEVNTIMIGGYDTISYAMMWCLYLLGLHPDIQEKAFSEIQSISDANVTYDDLCKLSYVECIIKETLRLYPVLPIYGRKLSKEIQFGKHIIPRGTNIAIFPYMLHRNPHVYPDPEKFNPNRFSENSGSRPWTHLPFSEGYRSCIGKKFAMMEMKVLLVHVLRRFSVTTLERIEDSDLEWKIFLSSIKPLQMLLTFRQQ